TTNYHDHAFLYSNGSMIDLNSLISTNSGWELYSAFGINNFDQIIGLGSMDGGEHIRSFILQIPEPGIPAFIVSASAVVFTFGRFGRMMKRRRSKNAVGRRRSC